MQKSFLLLTLVVGVATSGFARNQNGGTHQRASAGAHMSQGQGTGSHRYQGQRQSMSGSHRMGGQHQVGGQWEHGSRQPGPNEPKPSRSRQRRYHGQFDQWYEWKQPIERHGTGSERKFPTTLITIIAKSMVPARLHGSGARIQASHPLSCDTPPGTSLAPAKGIQARSTTHCNRALPELAVRQCLVYWLLRSKWTS